MSCRNTFKGHSSFDLDREKELGMIDFYQVYEYYAGKLIGNSKTTSCRNDPMPSKFEKKNV